MSLRYVRDAKEWADFVALVYRPFLDRFGIDFDPFLLTNRAKMGRSCLGVESIFGRCIADASEPCSLPIP